MKVLRGELRNEGNFFIHFFLLTVGDENVQTFRDILLLSDLLIFSFKTTRDTLLFVLSDLSSLLLVS